MHRSTVIFLAAGLVAACGDLSDLTTVTLGAPEIPTIEVDRTYQIDQGTFSGCPEGDRTVKDQEGVDRTVHVRDLGSACELSFAEEGVLLFDEEQARQASDKLQGRKIQGVKAVAVSIQDFSLEDETGAPFDIAGKLDGLSVLVDGNALFTLEDIQALANGPVEKQVDGALLDKLVDGVNNGTPVRADVAAALAVKDSALESLPTRLHLKMTLQPKVTVDVVKAASGLGGG
ncbi:MAG: hypothetical protein D6739_12125 [Nitrospirae bacterium]|nr:MAG: hypothetical protein D6739_12125 [Nitrospirota bacterium]